MLLKPYTTQDGPHTQQRMSSPNVTVPSLRDLVHQHTPSVLPLTQTPISQLLSTSMVTNLVQTATLSHLLITRGHLDTEFSSFFTRP